MLYLRGLTCKQLCAVNTANYYNLPYRGVFLDCFSLEVYPQNDSYIVNVCIRNTHTMNYLSQFLGVNLKTHDEVSLDILRNEKLSIVEIPFTQCFWIKDMYRINAGHHIMAVRQDNGSIRFFDPMFKIQSFELSKQFQSSNIKKVLTFDISPSKPDIDRMLFLANTTLHEYDIEKKYDEFFKQLREFVLNNHHYDQSMIQNTIKNIEINMGFYLAGSRGLYGQFLQFLQENGCQSLDFVIGNLLLCEKLWIIIRSILHKCYINHSIAESWDKVSKIAYELKQKETAIAEVLKKSWKYS